MEVFSIGNVTGDDHRTQGIKGTLEISFRVQGSPKWLASTLKGQWNYPLWLLLFLVLLSID